jgi:hypothetical protein
MATQILKRTDPLAGGHTVAVSLPVNGEVGERWRKTLEQRACLSMPRTPLPRAKRQAVQVDHEHLHEHECQDEPLVDADGTCLCEGYTATWQGLVSKATAQGYSTATQDIAQACFESALKARAAGEAVRCLCALAAHYRRVQWEAKDTAKARAAESARVARWQVFELPTLATRVGQQWVSHRGPKGEWATPGPEQKGGVDTHLWLDVLCVIKASRRQHTQVAVMQKMYGAKAMRHMGLKPLPTNIVSREMGDIRRDYEQMEQAGKACWLADRLFAPEAS